jgi:predicted MFS family arabinose efflux permease
MLKLAPLSLWTSICNTTVSGVFIAFMTETIDATPAHNSWTPQTKTQYCLLALVGQGIGEIIGSVLYGYIQDNYSNRVTTLSSMAATTLALIAGLLFAVQFQFTFWQACLMCGLWGLQDSMI